MAHRRSASAHRRTADSSRASESSEGRGKAARDGKIEVWCPDCGAKFRVPEDQPTLKIKCTQCTRVFFAKTAQKPPTKAKQQQMYWMLGIGIVVVLVIGIVINSMSSGDEANAGRTAILPPKIETGDGNSRVQDVKKWVQAMSEAKTFEIESKSDLARMQARFGIAPGKELGNMTSTEQQQVKAQILEALTTSPETQIFRDFEAGPGQLADPSMVKSSSGEVLVTLNPKDEKRWRMGGELKVTFVYDAPIARVTGWEVVQVPDLKAEFKQPKGSAPSPHKDIGKAVEVTRKIGDKDKKVREANVVPLDHLPDTPAPLRTEIDQLISQLVDLEQPPREKNKAKVRITEIGRPVIPRLLTKFHEIQGKTPDERIALNLVVRQLVEMTGHSYSYSPDDNSATEEMRQSALRQYYAWWTYNHQTYSGPPKLEAEDEATFGGGRPSRPRMPADTQPKTDTQPKK